MSPREVTADDVRAGGWAVAVHNDYRLNGESYTFWLFTKGDRCAKGEGRTDAEAIRQVVAEIRRMRVAEERKALRPGAEDPGCVQCGALTSDDGSPVAWRCGQCRGEVCRECALTVEGGPEYLEKTLCSRECWEAAGRPDE